MGIAARAQLMDPSPPSRVLLCLRKISCSIRGRGATTPSAYTQGIQIFKTTMISLGRIVHFVNDTPSVTVTDATRDRTRRRGRRRRVRHLRRAGSDDGRDPDLGPPRRRPRRVIPGRTTRSSSRHVTCSTGARGCGPGRGLMVDASVDDDPGEEHLQRPLRVEVVLESRGSTDCRKPEAPSNRPVPPVMMNSTSWTMSPSSMPK